MSRKTAQQKNARTARRVSKRAMSARVPPGLLDLAWYRDWREPRKRANHIKKLCSSCAGIGKRG